jgi:hypothetical protein
VGYHLDGAVAGVHAVFVRLDPQKDLGGPGFEHGFHDPQAAVEQSFAVVVP